MQFSALYGNQLDIELGSADRTQLFTTARRQKALNDAMHNFERITQCTTVYGQIPITSNVGEYAVGNGGSGVTAYFPNFITLHEREEPMIKRVDASNNVSYIQGENFVRKSTHQLDVERPGWRADPKGTPDSWYLRDDNGNSYLGLDPSPSPGTETWTLIVPYLASSVDMTGDTDVPFTISTTPPGTWFSNLVPYHQGLVHYAAALLEPLRKGYSAAQRQMGLYAGYIAQYETHKRKTGPNQITMRRTYYRDSSRSMRAVDPHRFP